MSVVAQQLWFTAPQQVEIREHRLPAPAAGEVLVQTLCSAISAGTELLVYRGQLPADISLDATLGNLQHSTAYPLQYGYASVGRIVTVGEAVDAQWRDALVFAFQPHASHFLTTPASVIRLPDGITPEAALFLANMETAVNLVQDGQPAIGENVVVLGQGIVGVLLLQLLKQFPLAQLMAVDAMADRRQRALAIGADTCADPAEAAALQPILGSNGADLVYEVSGVPAALNLAISLSGYASRIVIGSWYGNKSAAIELGGAAHRNRLQILTSQVSTIAPALSGRWDKQRRFDVAWQMIRTLQPQQWITQRAPLTDASTLYQQIHHGRADLLQAVFTYPP